MAPVHSLEVIPPCVKRPLCPKRGTLFRYKFSCPTLEKNVNVLERLTLTLIQLRFDVLDGEVKVEGECGSGFFVVESPRRYKDDEKLAQFQKESLCALVQCFDDVSKWPVTEGLPFQRPAVDPDLISVMQLQQVEGLRNASIDDTIYNLDLCGINQAGVLAYLCSIIYRSGFDIIDGKFNCFARLNEDRRASWCGSKRRSPANSRRRRSLLMMEINRHSCRPVPNISPLVIRKTVSTSAIPSARGEIRSNPSTWSLPTKLGSDSERHCTNERDGANIIGSARFQFHIRPKEKENDCVRTLRQVLDFPEPPKTSKKKCYILNRAVHKGPSLCEGWPQEKWAVPTGPMVETNFANGDMYHGELCGASRHGFGIYNYNNCSEPDARTKYEGQWFGNTKHGYGIGYWANGDAYAGEWVENQRDGFGVMITTARDSNPCGRFEGEWLNDMRNGLGVEEKTDSTYFGNFARGRRRGKGLEVKLHEHKYEVVVREGGAEADDEDSTTSRSHLFEALGQYKHAVEATASTHISHGSTSSNGTGIDDSQQTLQNTAKSTTNSASPSPELLRGPQLGHLLSIIGTSECVQESVSNDGTNGEELLNLPDEVCRKQFMMRDVEILVVKKCLRLLSNNYRDEWSSSALNTHATVKLPEVDINSVLNYHIINWDQVKKVRKISAGGFGTVYEGFWSKKGKIALKEMWGETTGRNLAELLKEATVSASLDHKNICKFLGIAQNLPFTRYILYEYLPWSLFDLIHIPRSIFDDRPKLNEPKRLVLAMCIASGVAYMHSLGVIHADLKSPNVLVSHGPEGQDITAKLCDFGHAAVRPLPRPHSRLGTPHWAAPEALRGEGISYPSDVWAFGVICWEMLTGKVPFGGLSTGAVTAAVGWGGKTPADTDKRHCVLGQIATDCMRSLAAERPPISDLATKLRNCKKKEPKTDHCFGFVDWLLKNF
eukprot:GEMP01005408.1.p1 GENE.GEMP01005408.1~~GEMP01005408.1.p1  ORF type:complete len:954 (+),score=118.76 GEMP01005408.1:30-2864(+)